LDALGAERIPDPTTEGDFCRRFTQADVETLMDVINEIRLRVWRQQGEGFFDEAVIDMDGSIAGTCGECKAGMALAYNGEWGYHPLIISLFNTGEPLYLVNRSGWVAQVLQTCGECVFDVWTFRRLDVSFILPGRPPHTTSDAGRICMRVSKWVYL
jgi:hypothetical protein